MMSYIAKHRFARISAKKVRPVAKLLRGRRMQDALETLRFMPQRGARMIEKVMKSAAGNAEDRGCRRPEDLIVRLVRIDGGPLFKRILPGARGMGHLIMKRFSHIRVELVDLDAGAPE